MLCNAAEVSSRSIAWLLYSSWATARSGRACTAAVASFADGAVHVKFAVECPDSATAYAFGIGAGRHNHVFGNLGVGRVTYDGIEGTSTLGFLELGYQLPVGPAQLCPIAGGTFQVGPDDDVAGIAVTARAISAGAALGLPVDIGFLTIIPNTAVKFDHVS